MTRIVVRELHRREELEAAGELARRIWGFDDRQLPATSDLQAVGHVGGLTAGAFAGRDMVGFVHGLPRTNLERPAHHSHMLGVVPEFRCRGVAVRLKLFQRVWCLERGIRLVTWTYDPLLVPNAILNLVRLRARGWRFLADAYGPLGGLYGGLPTDRFEVRWRLDAPDVACAARGELPRPEDAASLPRALPARPSREPRVAVEIPTSAPGLYEKNPAEAARARRRLRRIAKALFARGYEAVSIVPSGPAALYVFARR